MEDPIPPDAEPPTDQVNAPDKPRIADLPPEDGFDPPTDQEEQDAPVDFLHPQEARADPTVDDGEGHA